MHHKKSFGTLWNDRRMQERCYGVLLVQEYIRCEIRIRPTSTMRTTTTTTSRMRLLLVLVGLLLAQRVGARAGVNPQSYGEGEE
jgi:hypothetical protein